MLEIIRSVILQIRSRDKDHIAEKKVAISEVVEYLSQRLDPIKL